jgi:hypothetical protein
MSGQSSAIACNLNAFTREERVRHSAATAALKASVCSVEEVATGYRWHFDPAISTSDILQWVADEQRCCPFLDFVVQLARDSGPRWIQMTGRDGVKAFLAAEFADLVKENG